MGKKAWIIAGSLIVVGGLAFVVVAAGVGFYFYSQRQQPPAADEDPSSAVASAPHPSSTSDPVPSASAPASSAVAPVPSAPATRAEKSTAPPNRGKADSPIDDIEPDPVRDPDALDAPLLGSGASSEAKSPRRLAEAPRKLRDVKPVYPEVAKAARVQGVVILDATLDETGNVTSTKVLRSIPLLDEAAVEAVRQWRYAPTVQDGLPVPVTLTVTVTFTLR